MVDDQLLDCATGGYLSGCDWFGAGVGLATGVAASPFTTPLGGGLIGTGTGLAATAACNWAVEDMNSAGKPGDTYVPPYIDDDGGVVNGHFY